MAEEDRVPESTETPDVRPEPRTDAAQARADAIRQVIITREEQKLAKKLRYAPVEVNGKAKVKVGFKKPLLGFGLGTALGFALFGPLGAIAVDLGANVGIYTYLWFKMVAPRRAKIAQRDSVVEYLKKPNDLANELGRALDAGNIREYKRLSKIYFKILKIEKKNSCDLIAKSPTLTPDAPAETPESATPEIPEVLHPYLEDPYRYLTEVRAARELGDNNELERLDGIFNMLDTLERQCGQGLFARAVPEDTPELLRPYIENPYKFINELTAAASAENATELERLDELNKSITDLEEKYGCAFVMRPAPTLPQDIMTDPAFADVLPYLEDPHKFLKDFESAHAAENNEELARLEGIYEKIVALEERENRALIARPEVAPETQPPERESVRETRKKNTSKKKGKGKGKGKAKGKGGKPAPTKLP